MCPAIILDAEVWPADSEVQTPKAKADWLSNRAGRLPATQDAAHGIDRRPMDQHPSPDGLNTPVDLEHGFRALDRLARDLQPGSDIVLIAPLAVFQMFGTEHVQQNIAPVFGL